MPILKTEILGSIIEINYQEDEYEKLLKLIKNFKNRLNEFPADGRINNNVIMFLSALKAEDQLEESKRIIVSGDNLRERIKKNFLNIEKLDNEIFFLKDQIDQIRSLNELEKKNNLIAIKEIEELNDVIELIKTKIKNYL